MNILASTRIYHPCISVLWILYFRKLITAHIDTHTHTHNNKILINRQVSMSVSPSVTIHSLILQLFELKKFRVHDLCAEGDQFRWLRWLIQLKFIWVFIIINNNNSFYVLLYLSVVCFNFLLMSISGGNVDVGVWASIS